MFPKQNMNHWFIYFLFQRDYIWIFISNITNIINVSSVCTLEPHKQFWLIMACQMWVHFKRIGTRVMYVDSRRWSWSKIWDLWPTTKNFQRRYRLIPQTVFPRLIRHRPSNFFYVSSTSQLLISIENIDHCHCLLSYLSSLF